MPPARRHLVEDRAEGEDVGARVGLLALACSGAMYWNVPSTLPASVSGRVAMAVSSSRPGRPARLQLGQAEVEQLRARLVSMMLPGLRSRWMIPAGGPRRGRRRSRRRIRTAWGAGRGSGVGEGLALEVLHHEVVRAASRPMSERADVRVAQARDGAGLALEALAEAGSPARWSGRTFTATCGRAACRARGRPRPFRPRRGGRGSRRARAWCLGERHHTSREAASIATALSRVSSPGRSGLSGE